jgi:6-pyruvoyltetrahydropterin/6-carboxytetrahydropterin synthase
MTYRISKDFAFSASHVLEGLPEGHQCGRLHGHNYVVRVTLESDVLDGHGFVVDYGDLKPFGAWLDAMCDHRHLNDVFDGQPSAERMARQMADVLLLLVPAVPDHVRVTVAVSETPKTWAEYRP